MQASNLFYCVYLSSVYYTHFGAINSSVEWHPGWTSLDMGGDLVESQQVTHSLLRRN